MGWRTGTSVALALSLVAASCGKSRGDWGATCDADDACRPGLHCSVHVKDERGRYCTTTCERRGSGDDCHAQGAPAGWSCVPVLDPRDGECAK